MDANASRYVVDSARLAISLDTDERAEFLNNFFRLDPIHAGAITLLAGSHQRNLSEQSADDCKSCWHSGGDSCQQANRDVHSSQVEKAHSDSAVRNGSVTASKAANRFVSAGRNDRLVYLLNAFAGALAAIVMLGCAISVIMIAVNVSATEQNLSVTIEELRADVQRLEIAQSSQPPVERQATLPPLEWR